MYFQRLIHAALVAVTVTVCSDPTTGPDGGSIIVVGEPIPPHERAETAGRVAGILAAGARSCGGSEAEVAALRQESLQALGQIDAARLARFGAALAEAEREQAALMVGQPPSSADCGLLLDNTGAD